MDLARWQYWPVELQVSKLYEKKGYDDPVIHRAIVGYLKRYPSQKRRAGRICAGRSKRRGGSRRRWLEVFTGK